MRRTPDEITAWATVAAAAVAAIAAIVSMFQTFVAVRQTDIARVQADLAKAQNELAVAQLKIASQQTDLTKRQADIAAEAEQMQLRPYVSLRENGLSTKGDGLWHLKMKIKNNGVTPAMNVVFKFIQFIGNPNGEYGDDVWEKDMWLGNGPYDLHQGEDTNYDMQVDTKKPEFQAAEVGKAVVTAMRVDYEDFFGKKRTTFYCRALFKAQDQNVGVDKCPNPSSN